MNFGVGVVARMRHRGRLDRRAVNGPLPGPTVGRFAPSPTGPLHAGSLVAAMASWLDVRARGGRWMVRLEDIDGPREVPGSADAIVAALVAFGFRWDGPIVRQSERLSSYRQAFETLRAGDAVYPCGCSRREVEEAATNGADPIGAAVYPGTCRGGLPPGRIARGWRMRVPDGFVAFDDRAVGPVRQDIARTVGDFIVRRADGVWSYQLAVVVDDAAQGVTDVVRGADLLDSTPRQRLLQAALRLPHPRTLHVPLVIGRDGGKLSKRNCAEPLDAAHPLPALIAAAAHLGLAVDGAETIATFWERATAAWAQRWLGRPG